MARLKKLLLILVPPLVLVSGIAYSAITSPKAYSWKEPPIPDNSLAMQAQRKLNPEPEDEPVDKSAKITKKGKKKAQRQANFKGPYIVIDTHTNRIYWRTQDAILYEALCSTGTGSELVDTVGGRVWRFHTPRGIFAVESRATEPWWRKPDWAFIEEGEPIPDDPSDRLDPEVMGDYAIGFGDGFFIHGTLYERLIGVAATHGCVRLTATDLDYFYKKITMGTPVVIL